MDTRQAMHSTQAKTLDTEGLRRQFLIEEVFRPGEMTMTYSHIDRIVVGGVMPLAGPVGLPEGIGRSLRRGLLPAAPGDGNDQHRRSGAGRHRRRDGRGWLEGSRSTSAWARASSPSAASIPPIRRSSTTTPRRPIAPCPTRRLTLADASSVALGDRRNGNRRTINKFLIPEVVETCQLSMGMTKLEEGSLWNTMPTHTHERRMEVYLYFDVDPDAAVFHLMGQPQETRHIVVRNEQAVISPSWSIHSGVGTRAYTFIWGMVGENQTFDDMDHVAVAALR